jgi:hypothetical protein
VKLKHLGKEGSEACDRDNGADGRASTEKADGKGGRQAKDDPRPQKAENYDRNKQKGNSSVRATSEQPRGALAQQI